MGCCSSNAELNEQVNDSFRGSASKRMRQNSSRDSVHDSFINFSQGEVTPYFRTIRSEHSSIHYPSNDLGKFIDIDHNMDMSPIVFQKLKQIVNIQSTNTFSSFRKLKAPQNIDHERSINGDSSNSFYLALKAEETLEIAILPPFQFQNGNVYIGQWKKGLRHGLGILIWPDGTVFEGQWINDVAEGKGKITHPNGEVYNGNWVNDQAHGPGRLVSPDGAVFEGQWLNDRQNGEGSEKWPDGAHFNGMFKDGKKNGYGIFIYADGSRYEGNFVEGEFNGIGEYKWADGMKYKGEWVKSKRHGKGRVDWPDGSYYEGEYFEDMKHGEGKFRWLDRRVYESLWADSYQHGTESATDEKGEEKKGLWNKDVLVRWLD